MSILLVFKHTDFAKEISKTMFDARHNYSSSNLNFVLDREVTIPVHSVLELVYLGQTYVDAQALQDISSLLDLLGLQDVLSIPKQELFYEDEDGKYHDNENLSDHVGINENSFSKHEPRDKPVKIRIRKRGNNWKDVNVENASSDDGKDSDYAPDYGPEDDVKIKLKKHKAHNKKKRNNAPNNKVNKWRCDICDWSSTSKGELRKHKDKTHKPIRKKERKLDIKDPLVIRQALENLAKLKFPKKKELSYVCHICAVTYAEKGRLSRHMERSHPIERKCEYCNFKVKGMELMRNHITTFHKEHCHSCEICGLFFVDKGSLTGHISKAHFNGFYSCQFCFTKFKQKVDYEVHLADVHGQRQKCDLCDFTAKKEATVEIHKRSKHEGLKVPCEFCESTFKSQASKITHIKTVHQNFRIQCELCDHKGFSKTNLKYHILQVHGGISFPCTLCERTFPSKAKQNEHIRHDHKNLPRPVSQVYDPRRLKCEYCDWACHQPGRMKKHVSKKHPEVLISSTV